VLIQYFSNVSGGKLRRSPKTKAQDIASPVVYSELTMSWYVLLLAGLFEVGWAVGLEYSEGFSKPLPTVGTVVALVISMALLAKAVEDLPVGTAYAVWTGIGAVGTASLGVVLFEEPATLARVGFMSLIVVGIVGLHLVSGGQ
jgi:quaternary ammonium compound-resistance protein SugE